MKKYILLLVVTALVCVLLSPAAWADEIGGGAFGACPKLTTVTLQNNDNFTTDNGMLLTKDGATLVSVYGSNTSVTVPEGVAAIKEGACAGGGMLQSVVLPSGVTTIGEAAFSNATAFASITIPSTVTTIGANAFYGTVLATVYVAKGDTARVKALVEGTGYMAAVTYVEPDDEEPKPSIAGDDSATVTGDAESGYTVVPSTTAGTVEVSIPDGLDASKVTVELPPMASVKPNGAAVKVVNGENDITAFLDIPAAVEGVINLNDATVKDAIVEEVLDPEEGAVLVLTPSDPSIKTAPTRAGLTYTFYEGTTLEGMSLKATKAGVMTTSRSASRHSIVHRKTRAATSWMTVVKNCGKSEQMTPVTVETSVSRRLIVSPV